MGERFHRESKDDVHDISLGLNVDIALDPTHTVLQSGRGGLLG